MEQEKVVIVFSAPEAVEAQRIVLDQDAAGALDLVTHVVAPQIEAILHRGHCKAAFEGGRPPR